MPRIVVLGGGFGGLWSALGAARKRDEIGARAGDLEILLIDRNPYHGIRVRNYEVDLSDATVPLASVLDPVGVSHRCDEVVAIDPARRAITLRNASDRFGYDRLVLALGSEVARPPVPGLKENGFDIDTFVSAMRLDAHLSRLGKAAHGEARDTVVVVGGGFTGIEVATEMPRKLDHAGFGQSRRVILVDSSEELGPTIGAQARPVVRQALDSLGVQTRLGVRVMSVGADTVTLSSGEVIATSTVVWCAGLRPNPIAAAFPAERDASGRIVTDKFLRASGCEGVFAAGDIAACNVDGTHSTVMSCQFARPMGRFAGHNVVADLYGQPMLPLDIDWYVTVLDLGGWGALYTEGWDRQLKISGERAKQTKMTINHERIYPPRTFSRADLFAAAAPTLQAPPPVKA